MKFRRFFATHGAVAGAYLAGLALVSALVPTPAGAVIFCGNASWYAMTSLTASGERANPNALTAAHRTLPFGTKVVVENLANRTRVTVRINDRGPFIRGRVIDVSKAAARKLGMVRSGTARVRVTVPGRNASLAARRAGVRGIC